MTGARHRNIGTFQEEPWREHAACTVEVRAGRARTDDWFPGLGEFHEPAARHARSICDGCPVQADCLRSALNAPIWGSFGIWGGQSEQARRKARYGPPTVRRRDTRTWAQRRNRDAERTA